jgi:hypothetical protein
MDVLGNMLGTPAKTQGRLFISANRPTLLCKSIFKDIAANGTRKTHVLKCGRESHLVILPPKYLGVVPDLPTVEEGEAFQKIVLLGNKHISERGARILYKLQVVSKEQLAALNNYSPYPVGKLSPNQVRPTINMHANTGYRLAMHTLGADLPWFCPINRKYNLRYRLNEMVKAMSEACSSIVSVYDHWDLVSSSPSKFIRTIHELYFLQKEGTTKIKIGNQTLHFNVFMPLGTNANYKNHATSAVALSLKNPITFEEVV